MYKCSYADKYKANHRPRCMCIACREKYIDALEAKLHAQRNGLRKAAHDLDEAARLVSIYDTPVSYVIEQDASMAWKSLRGED